LGAVVERVLQKLEGVKPTATGWVAKCPSHSDQHQSLQISERSDLSCGLWCHAGCATNDVVAALDLNFSDLYAPAPNGNGNGHATITQTYDYRALDGTLLYQAVRYQPKDFRQRQPDGAGGWNWNMRGLQPKKVPYRLPELVGHQRVFIAEGERDCDRLWSLELPATTNIGGAGKWGSRETNGLTLAGVQHVVILPDNDDAGHPTP